VGRKVHRKKYPSRIYPAGNPGDPPDDSGHVHTKMAVDSGGSSDPLADAKSLPN